MVFKDFVHPIWQVYVPVIAMGLNIISRFLSKICERTQPLQQHILIKTKIAHLEERLRMYQFNFDK